MANFRSHDSARHTNTAAGAASFVEDDRAGERWSSDTCSDLPAGPGGAWRHRAPSSEAGRWTWHWGVRAAELQLLESPASAGCWRSKAEPVARGGAGGLCLGNWKWRPAGRGSQANQAASYRKGNFALVWMLAGGDGGAAGKGRL